MDDWSYHTVKIKPLIVKLESKLNDGKIDEAQVIAKEIESIIDGVLNWCYREGR